MRLGFDVGDATTEVKKNVPTQKIIVKYSIKQKKIQFSWKFKTCMQAC